MYGAFIVSPGPDRARRPEGQELKRAAIAEELHQREPVSPSAGDRVAWCSDGHGAAFYTCICKV